MNIETAKKIPISLLLEKLGAIRTLQKQHHERYLSPWRREKTASFHVDIPKNVWYDHGEGIGGNGVDLVCEHLKRSGVDYTAGDALRWMRNMTEFSPINLPEPANIDRPKKLVIENVTVIKHLLLKRYIKERGIDFDLAKLYLKEVQIVSPDKNSRFSALGLENEDGGWELRNPFFKGCIGHKAPTFIRGNIPKPSNIDVSEGTFDFLTILTVEKKERLDGDFLVLHSVSCLNKGIPFIKSYGYRTLRSWLQNDKAGIKASETLQQFASTEEGLTFRSMNKFFLPHKDVNAWHINKLQMRAQP